MCDATAKAIIQCGSISPDNFHRIESITTKAANVMLRHRSVLPMPSALVTLAVGLKGCTIVPADGPDDFESVRDAAKKLWPREVLKPGDLYMFMPFESIPSRLRGTWKVSKADEDVQQWFLRPFKVTERHRLPLGYSAKGKVPPLWCLRWSDINRKLLVGLLADSYRRVAYDYGGGRAPRKAVKRKAATEPEYVGIQPLVKRIRERLSAPVDPKPDIEELKKERQKRIKAAEDAAAASGRPVEYEARAAKRADSSVDPPKRKWSALGAEVSAADIYIAEAVGTAMGAKERRRDALKTTGNSWSLPNMPPCMQAIFKFKECRLKDIGRWSAARTLEGMRRGCRHVPDIEDLVIKPFVKQYGVHHGALQEKKLAQQVKGARTNKKPPFPCASMKGIGFVGIEMTCEFQCGGGDRGDNVKRCMANRSVIAGNAPIDPLTAHPALIWATTITVGKRRAVSYSA